MANEKRLIDANALLYEYCQANGCNEVIDEVCPNCFTAGLIANAPTVEAVPVVHGHWNVLRFMTEPWQLSLPDKYVCSECKKITYIKHNYCPNCGARMDLED